MSFAGTAASLTEIPTDSRDSDAYTEGWGGDVILGETDLIQVRQRGWENRVASENSVYKDPSTAFRVWIPTTHRGVLRLERCKDDRNGWESLVTRILDQRDGEILSGAKKRKSPIRLRKSVWLECQEQGGWTMPGPGKNGWGSGDIMGVH